MPRSRKTKYADKDLSFMKIEPKSVAESHTHSGDEDDYEVDGDEDEDAEEN